MYVTHHFSQIETLRRAQSWLLHLGFAPHEIETHTDGVLRLSVASEPGQLDAIHLLLSAVERSDPHGFPSFWDVARLDRVPADATRGDRPQESPRPRGTEIGWHPHEPAVAASPEFHYFVEMMSR